MKFEGIFWKFQNCFSNLGKFEKISDKIWNIWENFYSKTENSEKIIGNST